MNTKATLRWDVTTSPSLPDDVRERFLRKYRRRVTNEGELVLSSQRFRDQGRNVADCLAKLRDLLLEVAEPPVKRKVTKPSAAAKRRRVQDKRRQSQKKQRRRTPRTDD